MQKVYKSQNNTEREGRKKGERERGGWNTYTT